MLEFTISLSSKVNRARDLIYQAMYTALSKPWNDIFRFSCSFPGFSKAYIIYCWWNPVCATATHETTNKLGLQSDIVSNPTLYRPLRLGVHNLQELHTLHILLSAEQTWLQINIARHCQSLSVGLFTIGFFVEQVACISAASCSILNNAHGLNRFGKGQWRATAL